MTRLAFGLRRHDGDGLLDRDPDVADLVTQLVDPVERTDRHVPPVGVLAHQCRASRGPTPPMVIGIRRVGAGCCMAPDSVKCSPAWSIASPVHSPRRIASVSARRLVRSAPPAVLTPNVSSSAGIEPEPMPSSKRPPEAWSSDVAWSGEHRRMAERVAQHEMADREGGRVGEHPRRDRHRLPHRLVGRERRDDVVHEGDAFEPGRLGGPRPFDDGLVGHPHLRQEQVEASANSTSG